MGCCRGSGAEGDSAGGADEDGAAGVGGDELEGQGEVQGGAEAAEALEESRSDPAAGPAAKGGQKGTDQVPDRGPGHSGGLDAPVKPLSRRKQKLKEHCKLKKMKAKGIPVPGALLVVWQGLLHRGEHQRARPVLSFPQEFVVQNNLDPF